MTPTPQMRLNDSVLCETPVLKAFAAEYTTRSGHSADLDYLGKSLVRGFFGTDGTLVAGYAIATRNHRYLAALPAGVCRLPVEHCVEATHIWMDRSLSARARVSIYRHCLMDILRTGRRYVLGGSTVPKVVRIQQQALPKMIYDGPVIIDGIEHRGRVYCGTRWTIVRGFFVGAARRMRARRT